MFGGRVNIALRCVALTVANQLTIAFGLRA